jgi:hypothetical protein
LPASIDHLDFNPIELIQTDSRAFIHTPVPKEYAGMIQCHLQRDTTGLQGNFFPAFYLHVESSVDKRKVIDRIEQQDQQNFTSRARYVCRFSQYFLMAARRVGKINGQAEYNITLNSEAFSSKNYDDGYIGKLRGNNLTGTEYTLYDHGSSPNKNSNRKYAQDKTVYRRELAVIIYVS